MTLVEYGLAALLCDDPKPITTGSVCAVYRTTYGGRPALLKIPRVGGQEWGGEHVWREARALEGLSDIPSLPKLYKSWELRFEESVATLARFLYEEMEAFGLLREYVEGVLLGTAIARRSRINYDSLCDDVRAIHQQGYAGLDIHEDNLLVDTKGTLRLIDLGLAGHRDELSASAFASWKSFDYECLREVLPNSTARGRYA